MLLCSQDSQSTDYSKPQTSKPLWDISLRLDLRDPETFLSAWKPWGTPVLMFSQDYQTHAKEREFDNLEKTSISEPFLQCIQRGRLAALHPFQSKSLNHKSGPLFWEKKNRPAWCSDDLSSWQEQIIQSKGWVSIDRSVVAALPSTTPRPVHKSSTDDLGPPLC